MGNLGCQSGAPATAELTFELPMPREVSPRPSMLQPPSALLKPNAKDGDEAAVSIRGPRLSFDSKAYQLEMKKRSDSKMRASQSALSEIQKNLNNCGSISTIKQNDLQRSFDAGSKPPKCRKDESFGHREAHQHSSITQGKLPGRVEEFLQKQVEFVVKRNKSLERLRLLKEAESNKENPHRPHINAKSMKIAERKCVALRNKLQEEKATRSIHEESKPHMKVVRFDNVHNKSISKGQQASARNSPQKKKSIANTGAMSVGTIVLQFDRYLGKLGLQREDAVSYLCFLNLMNSLKMVSKSYNGFESLQKNQQLLLAQAWKFVKEPEADYAKASSILNFLMVLCRTTISFARLQPDTNECDSNEEQDNSIMDKFKPFVIYRIAAIGRTQPEKPKAVSKAHHNSSLIDFAPETQQHSRQVSILSQKTIVQIEVNLGSCVQWIRLSKDDDVEEVARCFIQKNGLSGEAQAQLVRLIRASLQDLN